MTRVASPITALLGTLQCIPLICLLEASEPGQHFLGISSSAPGKLLGLYLRQMHIRDQKLTTKIQIAVEELSGSFHSLQWPFLGLCGAVESREPGEKGQGVRVCPHRAHSFTGLREVGRSASSRAKLSCRRKPAEYSSAPVHPQPAGLQNGLTPQSGSSSDIQGACEPVGKTFLEA